MLSASHAAAAGEVIGTSHGCYDQSCTPPPSPNPHTEVLVLGSLPCHYAGKEPLIKLGKS